MAGTGTGSAEPILINAHRRLGKSYFPLSRMLGRCILEPGIRCVFGAPTYDQVRSIAEPLLWLILESCPEELRPVSRGYQFRFRNPRWGSTTLYSVLHLVGVDVKKGDNLRGTHADEVWLDEVADVRNLRYIVEDVIVPQFVGRDNPLLGMITTPPRTTDHDWVQYFRPKACQEGRYLEIRGSQNPDFQERDRKMVLRAIGGDEKSIAYQREVECQVVSDPEDLIVPEMQAEKTHIVRDVRMERGGLVDNTTGERFKLPVAYFPYVFMDTGYDPDYTAVLFAYADFLRQKLVVVDEVFERRMTLKDIASAVRKGTHKWFKDGPHQVRYLADLDKRGIADIRKMFKLPFRVVQKYDASAALARLRTSIKVHKVEILSNCVRLIDQLSNGIWNERRTDFERTEVNGHWDAGAALVYANRMVNLRENPALAPTYDKDNTFFASNPESACQTFSRALGRT